MSKNLKILFCGLGSSGQRHLRILKKNFSNANFDIYCYRKTSRRLFIDDNLITNKVKSIEEKYKINLINEKQFNENKIKFDIVFITNPIFLHLRYAIKFAKTGSHLFIEKPLSNSLKNINVLKKIAKKKRIKICCGYQFRFHPGIEILKKIIEKKKLGNLINSTFYFGEYLPVMHRYEDYKKTHMASFKQGGGSVLSLSHQVDLVNYLVGKPNKILKVNEKNSKLKIDVDDNLNSILKYKKHTLNLIVNFLDFPSNVFIIMNFEKGSIKWDYKEKYLTIANNNKLNIKTISFKKFNRNEMFKKQLKNFMNSIFNKSKINCDLNEAINTLKLCMKLKSNGPL